MAADIYPGDAGFEIIVRRLETSVNNGNMSFGWANRNGVSRASLCSDLVRQHYNEQNPAMSMTNAAWLGAGGSEASLRTACMNALVSNTSLIGYRWNDWSGRHIGNWHATNHVYRDDAVWQRAGSISRGDARLGHTLVQHQPVGWPARRAPHSQDGWNKSHSSEKFVWGWDPKESGNEQGEIGTHIGYPFRLGHCRYIIWLTPKSAFLEGINIRISLVRDIFTSSFSLSGNVEERGGQIAKASQISSAGLPKTSTEIRFNGSGFGQWVVMR